MEPTRFRRHAANALKLSLTLLLDLEIGVPSGLVKLLLGESSARQPLRCKVYEGRQ
jgi:hypothetical protein